MTGTSTSTGRNGGLAQREEVELRVPCEHQARVEKAVDARGLVRIAAIERKALVPEPGDGPHNAVRFEDSDPAVRAERRRHRAEGMGLQCKFRSFRQAISVQTGRRFRWKPTGRFGPKRHPVANGFWSRLWRTAAA